MEPKYDGPKLETLEGGKFGITAQFVKDMITRFKDGKAIPRRYVWEIIIAVQKLFVAEESLVNITLEKGMTCDVIGDVHGMILVSSSNQTIDSLSHIARTILRHATFVLSHWRTK